MDDIVVTPGRCPAAKPTSTPSPCAIRCKDNSCVPANKICDFVNDCGNSDNTDEKNCGTCDFENGKITFARPLHEFFRTFALQIDCKLTGLHMKNELKYYFVQRCLRLE